MGGIVKNAPNSLIWAVTLCFVAVLGAFVVLAVTGSDATELRALINTILNVVSVLLSGGALVAAGAAAKSAGTVQEQQENGHITDKVEEGVRNVLKERGMR